MKIYGHLRNESTNSIKKFKLYKRYNLIHKTIFSTLVLLRFLKNKSFFSFKRKLKYTGRSPFNFFLFVLRYTWQDSINNTFNYFFSFVTHYFLDYYFSLKSNYMLTEFNFFNFWKSNLIYTYLSYYRFFFFFFNLNLIFISSFSAQLFNRFKKLRKKFVTYHIPSPSYFDLLTKQRFEIASRLNTRKSSLFLYNYWIYLRSFLAPKSTKINRFSKRFFVTFKVHAFLTYCLGYVGVTAITQSKLFKWKNFSITFMKPNFNNFHFFSNRLSFKSFFPNRRKFKRSIFKQIKFSLSSSASIRFNKIKRFNIFNFYIIYKKFSNIIYFTPSVYLYLYFLFFTAYSRLKVYHIRLRFNWKFSKKKKKNLRKRFFFLKRSKRHNLHNQLRVFRFKKTLFRLRFFTGSKLFKINNSRNIQLFNKLFLLNLSTKIMLILLILTTNKFRRLLPKLITLTHFFYQKNIQIYFSNYLSIFKKWSNVVPFFYLPRSIKFLVTTKKNQFTHIDYLVYLKQIIGGFLESLSSRKIFFRLSTRLRVTLRIKKALFFLYKKHRNYQTSIGRGFFFNEMLFVCWYALFTKDLQFLLSWLTRAMCRMEIRKHRKFIKILRTLFTKYKNFFLKANNIKGIKLDIRGKLGVKGNAKKRHLSFNVDTTSFSKKKYRLDYRQGLVYTETGVLGLTMILTY